MSQEMLSVPRELLVRVFNYSDKRMPVEIDDLHDSNQFDAETAPYSHSRWSAGWQRARRDRKS